MPRSQLQSTRDRFLLLDSRVVKHTTNAKLVPGTVKKHPANPLFGEETPWEKRFDNLYGNVIYDTEAHLYKCWYSLFVVDHSAKGMTLEQRGERYMPPQDREMGVCYATSPDGLHWKKPNLGLVEYNGSAENNIVWRGPHGAGIFKDVREVNPIHRYKAIFRGLKVSTSSDGLNWSNPALCEGVQVQGDTHNNAFWAPTLEKYVGMTRTTGTRGREVARIESEDFVHWSKAEVVLQGTSKEYQPYAMPVFFHGGVYIGLVAIHAQAPEDRVWVELAWSPDTREWHRISEGTPLIPCSDKPIAYDYGCIFACANPVFLSDEVRLYYGGSDYLHSGWRNGSLCLATLRPDGFAGYEQILKTEPAVVTTTEIDHTGEDLRISADVARGGSIKVSILDRDGQALAQAKTVSETVTDGRLDFPERVRANKIRFRFELIESKLYSFSLEQDVHSRI